MTKEKKHISEKDFLRYLENQMTEAERNAFERELQKHPFEAEALEGLQQISPEELPNDLREMKSKITRKKRTPRYRYWAAAATILLLISSSILWFQLKDKSPVPELTENKKITKEEPTVEQEKSPMEKSVPENDTSLQMMEFTDSAVDDESEIKLDIQSNEKSATEKNKIQPAARHKAVKSAEKPVSKKPEVKTFTMVPKSAESLIEITDSERKIEAVPQNDNKVVIRGVSTLQNNQKSNKIDLPQKFGEITTLKDKVIHGKVISPVDNQPLPGATILQKGTKNAVLSDQEGNFSLKMIGDSDNVVTTSFVGMKTQEFHPSADSINIIRMAPEQSALGEVVVTGYGKPEINKALSSAVRVEKNVNVWPVGGMEELEKYLEEKAVLPKDYKQNRAVVELVVKFDKFGAISGFTNENSADSLLFEQAKKMIKEGPKWTPEIRNRQPVDSEKELKIVFRKKN